MEKKELTTADIVLLEVAHLSIEGNHSHCQIVWEAFKKGCEYEKARSNNQ